MRGEGEDSVSVWRGERSMHEQSIMTFCQFLSDALTGMLDAALLQ